MTDQHREEPPSPGGKPETSAQLALRIGKEELVIRQRYEAASVVNDILIALWFIVGSLLFFSEHWMQTGTWCFLLGSIQLLIRPAIRLQRQLHVQRLRQRNHRPPVPHDSSQDY